MEQKRENGYYWIKYFHWAVGKHYNGTWNLPGIETDFIDKELHEIGERIPSNEALKETLYNESDLKESYDVGKEFGTTEALFNNSDHVSRHQYENTPDWDDHIKEVKKRTKS